MALLQETEFIERGRAAVKEYINLLHKASKVFLKAELLSYNIINHKIAGSEQLAIFKVYYNNGYEDKDICTYSKFDEDETGAVTFYKYVCEVDE